jgi:hypothetical protein
MGVVYKIIIILHLCVHDVDTHSSSHHIHICYHIFNNQACRAGKALMFVHYSIPFKRLFSTGISDPAMFEYLFVLKKSQLLVISAFSMCFPASHD